MRLTERSCKAVRPLAMVRDHRTVLRLATRKNHDLAERYWSSPDASAFRIYDFLTSMHRLHAGLGVAAADHVGSDKARKLEQQRLLALRQDLQCGPNVGLQTSALPGTKDFAWGVLYALNGSALGANVLLRAGVGGQNQSAYLHLMQDYVKSGALSVFFRALNGQDLDRAHAIAGARTVFGQMAMAGAEPDQAGA